MKVNDWNSNRFIPAPLVMNGSREDVEVIKLLQPGFEMMSNELEVPISSMEHFWTKKERLSGKFSAWKMIIICGKNKKRYLNSKECLLPNIDHVLF